MLLGAFFRFIIIIIIIWAVLALVPGDILSKAWNWSKTTWNNYSGPVIGFSKNIFINSWPEIKNVWSKMQNWLRGPKEEPDHERRTLKEIIEGRRQTIQKEFQEE